jgi:hypothetical protein
MGVPQPIDTDEYHVGGGTNGECAIRVNDDGQEPESVSIADNIVEALRPVVPEEWFAAFQVETTAAFAVEGVDRRNDFRKTQVQRAARIHAAMLTPQVAAVGEHQASNERRGPPEQMVPHDKPQAERTGLQHGADVNKSHRESLRLIREVP